MNTSPEQKLDLAPIVRLVAAIGCLFFAVLAIKMGAESFHARSSDSLMSNWKGGTMSYEDGFKMTGIFTAFAAVWCYCAVRPKSILESLTNRKS